MIDDKIVLCNMCMNRRSCAACLREDNVKLSASLAAVTAELRDGSIREWRCTECKTSMCYAPTPKRETLLGENQRLAQENALLRGEGNELSLLLRAEKAEAERDALAKALREVESSRCNWPQEWGCIVSGHSRKRWCPACVAHSALCRHRHGVEMMIDPVPASVERAIEAEAKIAALEKEKDILLKALGSIDDALSAGWPKMAQRFCKSAIAAVKQT